MNGVSGCKGFISSSKASSSLGGTELLGKLSGLNSLSIQSIPNTYFIFNLHTLHLKMRRRNEIWAIMIPNERSFSPIGQKRS